MMTRNDKKNIFKCLVYFSILLPTGSHAQTTDSNSSFSNAQRVLASKIEMDNHNSFVRRNHAKELLGNKYYQKSVVKKSEDIQSLDEFIYQWTDRELRTKWKKYTKSIADTIMIESNKYGFDPVFLMAVIENESSFNPEIVGSFGEIGLMQITPQTAKWIAQKYHLEWRGAKSLKNPVTNIMLGSAYLAYLREKFDFHSQLYLAAYNMGSRNVQRALERQVWPKQYPSRVMQRYVKFYTKLNETVHYTLN